MVKSYLRWEHAKTFGIVASGTANAVWTPEPSTSTSALSKNTGAGRAVVPANEEVLTWDIKKGELVSRWQDPKCKAEVSVISQSKTDPDIFAVGYTNGSIRLWDSKTSTVVISFNGHKSAVSGLAFDHSGTRLASGGRDAHIIVWDLVAEVGLYRLRGHKDQITAIAFLQAPESEDSMQDERNVDGWILSAGKDTYIKLWDLSTQHCVETHVTHQGECWALAVSPDQQGCITAGNDGELKVWVIDSARLPARGSEDVDCIIDRGTLYRQNKDKGASIKFHPNGSFFAVHGGDKNVDIWRLRTPDEVRKALKRKRKRKEKKGEKVAEGEESTTTAEIGDLFVSYVVVRAGGKVKSIDWAVRDGKYKNLVQLLVACTNNSLEFYGIEKPTHKEKKKAEVPDYDKLYAVDMAGHRTDIRALALSTDDRMLASASNGSLKIWNIRTMVCIRTFECGYALCCSFLPGDKIVVVGTKTGEVELFDVASSTMLESIKAHDGAVWSLQVHPDGKSLVTGSADKTTKFWNFEIVQEEIPGTKRTAPRLRLVQARILKLSDDVLSLCISPNGKLLAVALLDNTVKIFFVDTLKHLLNLYGHKLPVLNMDISSDSKLIATCSADKNVKLWGLDFGDVHKSFFAHQDSIMHVAFEKNSHNFFSASKDHLVKYWDGDKFENIMKMEGHFGEIWALCVGKVSDIIVSASHDKSIRVWEQTDDPIFLEEERERELEELYESTLTASLDDPNSLDSVAAPESTDANKQTIETLMAGERLIEALIISLADLIQTREHLRSISSRSSNVPIPAASSRNPVFVALGGIAPETHVLNTLQKILPSHLQDALLVLPFDKVMALLTFLNIFAEKEINIPLTCRVLFFVLRVHHKQIVATKAMRGMLDSVRENLRRALCCQKDIIGFNLAGIKFVQHELQERRVRGFGDNFEEIEKEEQRQLEGKGKKRGFASLA